MKKKIYINSHYLDRRLSGLGRYARQIDKSLKNAKVVRISSPRMFQGTFIKKLLTLLTEAIIPSFKIAFNTNSVFISPAFSVPLINSRRAIVCFHDLAFIDYPDCYNVFERLYLNFNLLLLKILSKVRIVTPSEYVKNVLIDNHRISKNRITVISPYSEFKTNKKYLSKKRYLILLSNGHKRKNIKNTIDGFLRTKACIEGYSLKIVGFFDQKITANHSKIKIKENLSDSELESLITDAEAMLLYSYSEGFGFPIIEAASLYTPCLNSNVTSLKELNKVNYEKILTANEISSDIDRFVNDFSYREELHKNVEWLNENYNEDNFSKKWDKLLSE